ncbi:MAG: hypothetical protein K6E11_04305 [Bacilli bacterium]|nr:hypothetical protein [Bacilli bacterium]
MKKVQEIIKPFLAIILGAIILLYYFNWLTLEGAGLAIGIIALILAVYYIATGILSVLLGEKLKGARKVLDAISMALFPIFIFVYFLIVIVNAGSGYGPTGWVIAILTLSASIAASGALIVASFVNVKVIKRIAKLIAMVFILTLLLNILFDIQGNPIVLGNFDVVLFVIYFVYSYMLLSSLSSLESKEGNTVSEE